MPQAWLEKTREAWAQEANQALEQAVPGRAVSVRKLNGTVGEIHVQQKPEEF